MKIAQLLLLGSLVFQSSHPMHRPATICHPCTPFAAKDIAIARSKLFYASLDPRDLRVPRIFLQTHQHIASLSEWHEEHWKEFGQFEKVLENSLKKSFKADLVNVACLMNLAGQEGTHTHWHFIPRMPKPMTIIDNTTKEEHIFEDPCYGKPYDMNVKNYRSASPAMMRTIITTIQKNLDITNVSMGQLKNHNHLKNIIFDLGGVLLEGDVKGFVEEIRKVDSAIPANFATIAQAKAWIDWQKGKSSQEKTVNELSTTFKKAHIEKLFERYLSPQRPFDEKMIGHIKMLKTEGFDVYLLSNLSRESYDMYIASHSELFAMFDGIMCSFQVDSVKPDPLIYEKLLAHHSLNPKESLFIDDSRANVSAAQELGFKGIVYNKNNFTSELAAAIQ